MSGAKEQPAQPATTVICCGNFPPPSQNFAAQPRKPGNWLPEKRMRFRPIFRKVARVFRKRADDKVREFYMHMPEVQWPFPLALLPPAQKEFIDWLLGEGRARHRLSDGEIGQLIDKTSEEPARGIAETYLINPDWQKRFPPPLDRQQQTKLLEWLRSKFPEFPALKKICRLTGREIERARRSGRDAARSKGVKIL